MPPSKHDIEKACEYAMGLGISNEFRGSVVKISPDRSLKSVSVIWTYGGPEVFGSERFIEMMKETAARLGDAVEF